jgi:perosamine synthetase
MRDRMTRRHFVAAAGAIAATGLRLPHARAAAADKPAMLGGTPAIDKPFPTWPIFDQAEEQALLSTLSSGRWFRGTGSNVAEFESAYARLIGAKHCIATSSGTSALIASLMAHGVGPGDEVILTPYTFVACVNAILSLGAMPVFADVDRQTFQIDAGKIEVLITDRTVAIMPVHIGGNAFDVDVVLEIARKHKLAVVEDACQAHLAEWRRRRVGAFGDTGCFSFQASKNLTGGEGGAILTDNDELAEKCHAIQTNGHPRRGVPGRRMLIRGANFRMSEFHAALLLTQMKRLPEQATTRDDNAAHLTRRLKEIPGIAPAAAYNGCTRNAWHLYMFRYDPSHFADLPRAQFLRALAAEGIPASGGYAPLNREPFITETLQSRPFQRAFPESYRSQWPTRNECPENERLCGEAVWFTQNMLLADTAAMDRIADAIARIQRHAAELPRG